MLVIPVFTPHIGCPHQCLFCNQEKIAGKEQAAGEVNVGSTIEEWLGRSRGRKPVQVAFYGGSFTCLPEKVQKERLCAVQPYIDRGLVDSIRLSTRPDCINPAICRLLSENRVEVVELGVQSLNDAVLHASHRGHDAAQCRLALELLQTAGFKVGLQLMLGLPGESRHSFLQGVEQAVHLRPDFVRLYPTLVVEGSGLAEQYRAGEYQPQSLDLAVLLAAAAYKKFAAAEIPVIRMGLQATDSLMQHILAGPYHPSFGEMVLSRVWLQRLRAALRQVPQGQHLQLHISYRDRSAVTGLHKTNLQRLAQLGFAGRFTIVPDRDMERGKIRYVVC